MHDVCVCMGCLCFFIFFFSSTIFACFHNRKNRVSATQISRRNICAMCKRKQLTHHTHTQFKRPIPGNMAIHTITYVDYACWHILKICSSKKWKKKVNERKITEERQNTHQRKRSHTHTSMHAFIIWIYAHKQTNEPPINAKHMACPDAPEEQEEQSSPHRHSQTAHTASLILVAAGAGTGRTKRFRLRCDAMMLMVKKRRRQADKKWKWKKNWMKLSFGIFRGKHFARTQECHSRMRVRHHSPKHVESTNCFSDSNVQHSTTYLCSTSVGRLRWRTIGRCFDIYPSQTPQSQCQTHKWIAFICRIYFLGWSLTVVGVVDQLLRFKENIHWKMTTYEKITHQQRWAHTYIVRDVLRKY